MVKQTKTFKKGNVTKKALSAILAASMVMTSSSFVMAGPVEVEAVDVVEDVNAGEESVGADRAIKIAGETTSFTGKTADEIFTAIKGYTVTITNDSNVTRSCSIEDFLTNGWAGWTVTLTKPDGTTMSLDSATTSSNIPTTVGKYTITVASSEVRGSIDYEVIADLATDITPTFAAATYTGIAVYPTLTSLKIGKVTLTEGSDYEVGSYYDNVDACEVGKGAYVEVSFKGAYEARGTQRVYFAIQPAKINNAVVTVEDSPVYNGAVQEPKVTVKFKGSNATGYVTLTEGTDYKVEELKSKDAGKYAVTIAGLKNFSDTKTVTQAYEIKQQEFKSSTVTVETPTVPFVNNTRPYEAKVIIKDKATGNVVAKDATELAGAGLKVQYWNGSKYADNVYSGNKEEGTYRIKLVSTGLGNYKAGEILATYTVGYVASSLQKYVDESVVTFTGAKTGTKNEYEYVKDGVVPTDITIAGAKFTPDGKVSGSVSSASKNFDVIFPSKEECKTVGTYEIKLVGKADREWKDQTVTLEYKVVPKVMTTPTGVKTYKTSTGTYTTDLEIKDGDYTLVKGVDYDYAINATGTSMTITFKGNYTSSTGKAVSVNTTVQKNLDLNSDAIVGVVNGEFIYNGKVIVPSDDSVVLTEVNGDKTITLRKGTDYEITGHGTNVNVGKGYVTVTGKGFYAGTLNVEFDIKAGETVKDNYKLDTENLKAVYDFEDANIDPVGDVKVKTTAGKTLTVGKDYTIKYLRDGKEIANPKSLGSVTLEYTITETKTKLTASYRVAKDLSKYVDVTEKIEDQQYTGSAVEPEIKVVYKNSALALTKGKDYVVVYDNNVERGTGYVTVEGIGDYYGTIYRTFKITGQVEQSIEVLAAQARDIQNRTLNSKATTVKFEAGKAPKTAVTYTSSDEDVVKVDETGKITYTGLGEATITIKAAETAEYKAAEATMTVKVGLTKPSFTPFSKNNAFTLTSSTVKGAEKFEVQYATKKDFSNKKSVKFTATSGKVRQVKVSAGDKKTYYVRVRAISGTETSAWSTTKTVATK